MTEREILELAAKACGQPAERLDVGAWCDCAWNPLHDDGDCKRMEAHLSIDTKWYGTMLEAYCRCMQFPTIEPILVSENFSDHDNDRAEASRWASTRVAAEIGRRMT